jgi:hypothetical protein
MKIGNPFIRKFSNGGTIWDPGETIEQGGTWQGPANFGQLTGAFTAGENCDPTTGIGCTLDPSFLSSEFDVVNPEDYTQFFLQYDPSKQEQLGQTYSKALDVAGATARGSAGTIYDQTRKAMTKGPGFGGIGNTLETALGQTFATQEQAGERAQQQYHAGVYDEMQDYTQNFYQQVANLGDMGADFCPEGQWVDPTYNDDGTIQAAGYCTPSSNDIVA